MRLNSAIGACILAMVVALATSCGRPPEEVAQSSPPTVQNTTEPKNSSWESAKESLMGAPLPRGLDDKITEYSTVLVGRRISIKDTPRPELTYNITGMDSDPNFAGAYNREKISYDREIVVEVEKYIVFSKNHYPALFNEDKKQVTLRTEVYDQLEFDVPESERTKDLLRAAYDKQIKVHAEQIAEVNKTPQEKSLIYVASARVGDPAYVKEIVPNYEELNEWETERRIKTMLKTRPADLYVFPKKSRKK